MNTEEVLNRTYDGFLTDGKGHFWHSLDEACAEISENGSKEETVYGVKRIDFQVSYPSLVQFIKVKSLFDFEKELKDFLNNELASFLELCSEDLDFRLKGEDEFIRKIFTLAKRHGHDFFLIDSVQEIVDQFNSKNQHIWLMIPDTELQAKLFGEDTC